MAEATDWVTLDEAKAALEISPEDESDDVDVAAYVSAVSRLLDSPECFGSMVRRTITDEEIQVTNAAGAFLRGVAVAAPPVTSWASVVEYYDGTAYPLTREVPTSAPPADGFYALRATLVPGVQGFSGVLTRRFAGAAGAFQGPVVATYVSGRVADTASVPADFKRAAVLTLKHLWRVREPSIEQVGEYQLPRQSFPTWAVPKAAAQMAWEYWRGGSAVS